MNTASCNIKNSRVAQLAEQVAVNHPVGGSNPSPGAISLDKWLLQFIYFAAKQHSCIMSAIQTIFPGEPPSITTFNIMPQNIPSAIRDPGSAFIPSNMMIHALLGNEAGERD